MLAAAVEYRLASISMSGAIKAQFICIDINILDVCKSYKVLCWGRETWARLKELRQVCLKTY